jgi:fructose-1,6-bisphosphatase/inositol monophosphatase family enzyme
MIREKEKLLQRIREIQAAIRDQVVLSSEQTTTEQMAEIIAEQGGDTIFAIDRISEQVLLEHFAQLSASWSFVLIAEGLGEDGVAVFPQGMDETQAELRIIIDPIDGTRGLMYQKRPAWILTGVAPNRGAETNLADIELAVQTEIPLVKQHLSDVLWAVAGEGYHSERFNRLTGETFPLHLRPSQAETIAQGFGGIARFFPGSRAALAAMDDALVEEILGPNQAGKVQAFEDQYICTGGQLYELLAGHDRWLADLRPVIYPPERAALCCHAYDLCTELIAREAGIMITDHLGKRLAAPLDVTTGIAWMGFANRVIHQQVAPLLQTLLRTYQLNEI